MTDGPNLSKGGGVVIPGYEVERELGRGGFAVVYRANQPKLRRTVALKVLTNVDPSDEEAKRRFEAECQAIGSLSWHPHVVTVYDAGQTDEGLPFLAMENLPSGTLQVRLAEHGPAPWDEVLRVTVQMCDALGAAHQAGILHRDIKPANVLTSRIGDYKLADFGIARFGDSQRTATGVITGTVAYTAPEVLRGTRASTTSDIYSLGAMLYAVASGQTPFVRDAEESVVAIMYRVASEEVSSLVEFGVPADVDLLIRTLMDKDPDKRPASALEVAQWAQYIEERHGIQTSPLHTDPDLEPALPPAAIAAGAADAGTATPPPPPGPAATAAYTAPLSPPTGPPPAAPQAHPAPAPQTWVPPTDPASYTPAPQPSNYTPAPQPAAPAQSYGAAPASGAYAAPGYGQPTGGYDPATGYQQPGYGGYQPEPDGGGGGGGKLVAIAAVIALVVVVLIIAIAAIAGGGDKSADGGTRPTRSTVEPDSTEGPGSSTESTTTTTDAPTSTEGGLSELYRTEFLDACTEGQTERYCTCVLDELESRYSAEELEGASAGSLPEDFNDIVAGCI